MKINSCCPVQITALDVIPPRGCAFVCMNRRMDAARALKNLNKFRLQGKQVQYLTLFVGMCLILSQPFTKKKKSLL